MPTCHTIFYLMLTQTSIFLFLLDFDDFDLIFKVTPALWMIQFQRRRPCSLSALYLLNQCLDFDQTGTDTLLGQGKDVVRFWWPWPHFKGHASTLNFSNFDQKSLSAPCLLNQITGSGQTLHIVTLGWFKDLVRFWRLWPNFQGHHTIKTVKMSLVCTLSPEPNGGFWPNLHRNITGTWGRN